jgi:hypothetical protein
MAEPSKCLETFPAFWNEMEANFLPCQIGYIGVLGNGPPFLDLLRCFSVKVLAIEMSREVTVTSPTILAFVRLNKNVRHFALTGFTRLISKRRQSCVQGVYSKILVLGSPGSALPKPQGIHEINWIAIEKLIEVQTASFFNRISADPHSPVWIVKAVG